MVCTRNFSPMLEMWPQTDVACPAYNSLLSSGKHQRRLPTCATTDNPVPCIT